MRFSSIIVSLALTFSAIHAAPTPQALNGAKDCAAAQKLADGIDSNIAVQKQEQAGIKKIAATLQATPIDMAQFTKEKAALLTTVDKGITIREDNQRIAPSGNAAIAGLAKIQEAQKAEKSLTSGLTGDPAQDNATVATLEKDFAGGIKQNQQNKKDALSGCSAK